MLILRGPNVTQLQQTGDTHSLVEEIHVQILKHDQAVSNWLRHFEQLNLYAYSHDYMHEIYNFEFGRRAKKIKKKSNHRIRSYLLTEIYKILRIVTTLQDDATRVRKENTNDCT